MGERFGWIRRPRSAWVRGAVGYGADVLSAFAAVLGFAAGRVGASWWWLVGFVPVAVLIFAFRVWSTRSTVDAVRFDAWERGVRYRDRGGPVSRILDGDHG